jgi:hypothetical protein
MTIALTLDQVRAIYKAGILRGNDEATSFDWGCSPSGKEDENLAEALHEIANEGRAWASEHYVPYSDVATLFATLEHTAASAAKGGEDRG